MKGEVNLSEATSLLKGQEKLNSKIDKIQNIVAQLANPEDKGNLTDIDAPLVIGKKRDYNTYYNPQVGCIPNQTIIYASVCTDANDKKQLKPCIEGAQTNLTPLSQSLNVVLADPGYSSYIVYEYLKNKGLTGYVPDQDFNKDVTDRPYHKEHFVYKETTDESSKPYYLCPQGKKLTMRENRRYKGFHFKIFKGIACENCPVKTLCTKGKVRSIQREIREPLKEEMRTRLSTEEGKEIYKKRLHPVEAIFGFLKENLKYTHFLLRGLQKVDAEFKLMCLTFNLRKLALHLGFKMTNLK